MEGSLDILWRLEMGLGGGGGIGRKTTRSMAWLAGVSEFGVGEGRGGMLVRSMYSIASV